MNFTFNSKFVGFGSPSTTIEFEADSLLSYLKCKLPHLLLSLRKTTHNITNKKDISNKTFLNDQVNHIKTPENVKAVYMSSWVAGTPSYRDKIVKMIEDTELNAVIIDVKDNTGVITWDGRANKGFGDFIESLHKKNIYVIGRSYKNF